VKLTFELVAVVRPVAVPVTTGAAGAVVSTESEMLASALLLSAASTEVTLIECQPSVRSVSSNGEVHGVYEAESTEHKNVASASPVNDTE
jgi:hypothetical protein